MISTIFGCMFWFACVVLMIRLAKVFAKHID